MLKLNRNMIPQAVASFRDEYRDNRVSKYYSGVLHFCFTSFVCLTAIAYAASATSDVTWIEWLTVPITFLFANFIEYRGHKGPMHRPVKPLNILFLRHTLEHHRFYTHDAMAWGSTKDFKMVLFPPVMIVFFIGLHAVPLAMIFYYFVSANVAYLFAAVAVGYFLTYEWLHFSYHAPEDSWVGRLSVVKILRRLHADHHNPLLMNHYNFNITFPICDILFGTRYKGGKTLATESMAQFTS